MSSNEINFEEEDATDMSLSDIYNQLLVHSELILTIPAGEEATLRKGLAQVKAKQNQKLKDAGIRPENLTLSYQVTPKKDDKGVLVEGVVAVHIVLAKRTQIKVLGIAKPDVEI